MTLLDHRLGGRTNDEYQSALVSGIAVLGLRPEGGWQPAANFTPTLSGIIKVARMLVAQ